jgi:hypothetical protein
MKHLMFLAVACATLLAAASPYAQETTGYSISWDPISDPGVREVRVYRSTDGSSYSWVGTVPVSLSSYRDAGVDVGIQYWYRLTSANAFGGESAYSAVVTGLTLCESNAEALKDRCRVTSVTRIDDSSCTVAWTTAASCTGKVLYQVLGSDVIEETSYSMSETTSHSVVLAGLEQNRLYMIRAVGLDGSGNLTRSCVEYWSTGTTPADIEFVANATEVIVPENGTAQFGLRLSEAPNGDVEVLAARASGDMDIDVESGASLTFTAQNWSSWQFVTLRAADDADVDDGEAQIIVASNGGDFVPALFLTAREDDDDPGGEDPGGDNLAAAVIAIYPVPFVPERSSLTMENLPSEGSLGVFDIKGRCVWDAVWSGVTSLKWDGANKSGVVIAAGRYFVVIRDAAGRVVERRALLAVR